MSVTLFTVNSGKYNNSLFECQKQWYICIIWLRVSIDIHTSSHLRCWLFQKKVRTVTDVCLILVPTGDIGQTFVGPKETVLDNRDYAGYTGASYTFHNMDGAIAGTNRGFVNLQDNFKKEVGEFDEDAYRDSRWCYDTPGVVNPEQVQLG